MLPKWISYLIAYDYHFIQSYIGIINHISNWFWINESANRQHILRNGKKCFILIFLNQILWQVLCHGCLFSTWWMEKNFVNPAFVSCSSWKIFMGVRSCYCNKMPILWVYVDTIHLFFCALAEADNISQKSSCLHFFKSIRNISIKTHRL